MRLEPPWDLRVGTFSPNPWPPEKGEKLAVQSVANGYWFNQLCLCNEASIKTQENGVWIAWGVGGKHMEIHRVEQPERTGKLFPHTLLYVSLPFGCFWAVPLTITGNKVSTMFPELCKPFWQINWTQEGNCGKLWFIASSSDIQVISWAWDWHLNWSFMGLSLEPVESDAIAS